MLFLVLLGVGAVLIGYLVGRWGIVFSAAAVMPIYFLGVHAGWWGHGVGDGWEAALMVTTLIVTGGTALGVPARRAGTRASAPA